MYICFCFLCTLYGQREINESESESDLCNNFNLNWVSIERLINSNTKASYNIRSLRIGILCHCGHMVRYVRSSKSTFLKFVEINNINHTLVSGTERKSIHQVQISGFFFMKSLVIKDNKAIDYFFCIHNEIDGI